MSNLKEENLEKIIKETIWKQLNTSKIADDERVCKHLLSLLCSIVFTLDNKCNSFSILSFNQLS